MTAGYQVVRLLADGRFHSGEEMAQQLGVSRSAVWKQLQGVKNRLGLEIFSVRGRGYRLAQPLELLDREVIEVLLREDGAVRPAILEVHASIDSTNSYLMRRAAEGAESGHACFAEQQTSGRGRRGRNWVSPFGSNIYLSILWRYAHGPADLSGLSLAAGVAVVRGLESLGVGGLGLKWPNDVLWDGRKLAGLLLEVVGEQGGPSRVVLGLGLNSSLSTRQGAEIEQPWVDLASIPEGSGISRNKLAAGLLRGLLQMLENYHQQGLDNLAAEWRRYDLYQGKPVVLRMGDRLIEGVHKGIDGNGALLLDDGHSITAYHGGEVSLRPA